VSAAALVAACQEDDDFDADAARQQYDDGLRAALTARVRIEFELNADPIGDAGEATRYRVTTYQSGEPSN
jgi:hypothetical protein